MTIAILAGPKAKPRHHEDIAHLLQAGAAHIPASVKFLGEAHFPGNIVMEGFLSGNLQSAGDHLVVVAASGTVDGLIGAGNARVEGMVRGKIECPKGTVEFLPTSRCTVDVLYRELDIARGACVDAELRQAGAAHG